MRKWGALIFCLIFSAASFALSRSEMGAGQFISLAEATPLSTMGSGQPFAKSRSAITIERELDFCDAYLRADIFFLLPRANRDRFATSCLELAQDHLRGTPFSGHARLVKAAAEASLGNIDKALGDLDSSRLTAAFHGRHRSATPVACALS